MPTSATTPAALLELDAGSQTGSPHPATQASARQAPASQVPGSSVNTTWAYTLGSIVFILLALDATLVAGVLQDFSLKHDVVTGFLLAALVCAVATQIRYCWFLRAGLGGGLPGPAWTIALLVPSAGVWLLGLLTPADAMLTALPLWLAACLLACLLPQRQRWLALAAGLAISLLQPAAGFVLNGQASGFPPDPGTWMLFAYAIFMPFVLLSSLWWWRVVVELDRHRQMAGELAVAQERLRFAADLHDIQGHHLQVIALKSELAERLLTVNVDAARENIHQARLIAKQAMEETRSLVSGYREIALDNELENACEVLTAAGARCELAAGSLPGTAAARQTLAMAVREATTNILRHSNATRVSITLTDAEHGFTLSISNNGVASQTPSTRTPGSGLAGLRQRVGALGGTLRTTTDTDCFEFLVWVPGKGTIA